MLRAFLDAFLPASCVGCDAGVDAGFFCRPCADTLVDAGPADVVAAYAYGGAIAAAVRRAKLSSDGAAVAALRALAASSPRLVDAARAVDGVAYVPAHPLRRALRGYDLPALLASSIAAAAQRPVVDALRAGRFDARMARGADRAARAGLVAGRFLVAGEIRGRSLLLVDDVTTTGATLGEAAQALEAAGARVVRAALAATP